MKKVACVLLCSFACALTSSAAGIAWVSFHPADDTPSATAAGVGFTQAPDVGYTSLLEANGFPVTRFVSQDAAPTAFISQLNSYDLVIISRSAPSGHYQADPEPAAWNGITSPMIMMGGYILRNSRLGFFNGGNVPDTTSPDLRLKVNDPSHPIFAGVALDGDNVMVSPFSTIVTPGFTNLLQRGISTATDPIVGAGTILATVANSTDPAFGGTIIAEWPAGATMNATTPNTVLGAPRLVFLSGSREASGFTGGDAAGIYDLNPAGERVFLNAVSYMIPEPSALALLALGGLGLFLWRRKA